MNYYNFIEMKNPDCANEHPENNEDNFNDITGITEILSKKILIRRILWISMKITKKWD